MEEKFKYFVKTLVCEQRKEKRIREVPPFSLMLTISYASESEPAPEPKDDTEHSIKAFEMLCSSRGHLILSTGPTRPQGLIAEILYLTYKQKQGSRSSLHT
jgi:hypothetical protein